MPEKKKNSKKLLYRTFILNTLIMFAGLTFVIMFVQHMQQRYSEMKTEKSASVAISSIVETMDENTEKVEMLIERYHQDNNMILNDIAILLDTGKYRSLTEATVDERCSVMQELSNALKGEGSLFVTDNDGTVVLSPRRAYLGVNVLTNGTFSKEQFTALLDDNTSCIQASPKDEDNEVYFYGRKLNDEYNLIYGIPSAILEEQYAALKNLGPILSNTVLGETGFLFAVNAETGEFLYFNNGICDLTSQNAMDYGLTPAALEDQYSGTQTIDGTAYHCYSKFYSSPLYGEYIVISAVSSLEEVYANNRISILVTALAFLIGAALCIFYSALLHVDPDQLVYYDENILDRGDEDYYLSMETIKSIHNVRLFTFKGEQIYFKLGVAKALAPVIVIVVTVLFAISYNAQTLIEISKGLAESAAAIRQAENVFSGAESSSEILMNRYQNQFASKIGVLAYMLEEDPDIVFNHSEHLRAEDSVHTYKNEQYAAVFTDAGIPLTSIANSSALQNLAEQNGLDTLYIMDDHGRTIATNTDRWYFVLSDDPEHQSHEFRRIALGEIDQLVQKPQEDEYGQTMQYVGNVFFYYTLDGDGADTGRYVTESAYHQFMQDGYYLLNDESYTVTRHRGIVQGGICDETINRIMESTEPQYLIHQMKVDTSGFMVLFDNTADHTCLWAPEESAIGKTSEELEIPSVSFSESYKGFTRVNGTDYFLSYFFKNGYWIAAAIPSDDLFAGRLPISLITVGLSILFFLFLFLSSVLTYDSEEKYLREVTERRIVERNDNDIIKIRMKNGSEKYARTAASRFSATNQRWKNLIPSQKLSRIFSIILAMFVMTVLICATFSNTLFGADSVISYIANGNWEHSFNYFAYVAFVITLISVFAISTIISMLIRFIISNMGTRVETIGRLILSVVKYGSVLFSIFYGLSLLGVSTAGLVTSASIMSVVIGLGSQSLISDIIAGIFIVFEGSFRVGDIVSLDKFEGMVVDIGLRTTKIEDTAGNIQIYNNSSIKSILNMTKKASTERISLIISYKAQLEQVEELLRATCSTMMQKYPGLLYPPRYVGITSLTEDGMELSIDFTCAEKERGALNKAMTREFYLVLRDHQVACLYV